MATRAMPKTGELIAGKYRIDTLIGEGGMGAVFSATHAITGRKLAVKWMLPEVAQSDDARQRLVREAQAAGRIDHPAVVDVYDVGEHEGSPFLVMELLQGESLTKALERGALKIPEIVKVLIQAMEGVAAAHQQGVVHRDIKPDNIFLCRDAQGALLGAKVLDFGISKVSSMGGHVNPRLTKTGAVMGTPYYMSPEQIRGASEIDHRVDVYAFGVILYEALTGRVPFDGKTYSALVLEIATGTPERPCAVNPRLAGSLERVILKAMARDVTQRFQDMESLTKALLPFTSGGTGLTGESALPDELGRTTGSSTTPFTSVPPAPPVKKTPAYVAAIAIAIVLGAGLALWGGGDRTPEPHLAAPADIAPAPAPPPSVPAPAPVVAPQPEPVAAIAATADAGVAIAAQPAQPAQPTTAPHPIAAPRGDGRAKPPIEPPHTGSTRPKGSGRSGTIASDEF